MVTPKEGSKQNLESANRDLSDQSRVNDEDNLDTGEISHNIEEGDEDYDDEELDNEELTDEDFEVDEEGDEDDEEIA